MTKNTGHARCHLTAFDELECTIPYHRGLIEEWKDSIPYRSRSYDPDTKAWRFLAGYQDLATTILLQHYPDAELPPSRRKREPSWSAPIAPNHFAALHLLPSAPPELVSAAFRCLAKLHHPDVGGSDATMRELTAAHDALARRLGA